MATACPLCIDDLVSAGARPTGYTGLRPPWLGLAGWASDRCRAARIRQSKQQAIQPLRAIRRLTARLVPVVPRSLSLDRVSLWVEQSSSCPAKEHHVLARVADDRNEGKD